MSGIFISKGMTVRIPVGGLRVSPKEGGIESTVKIEVNFDTCPSWLEIAIDHLEAAKIRNVETIEAWKLDDKAARARSLENEFKESMQAIVAAAIAMDSFYGALREKMQLDAAIIAAWQKNRTARYVRISEICRLAFGISPESASHVRDHLKQVFQFRDRAVHPSAEPTEAILHPELNVGVEWRFASFRFENAIRAVWVVVRTIDELISKGRPSNKEVQRYVDYLKPQLKELSAREVIAGWEPPAPK